MADTRHGHHIFGTTLAKPRPATKERCGGPGLCGPCSTEASLAKKPVPLCLQHHPRQHRDARPPWCNTCGLTAGYEEPLGRLDKTEENSVDNPPVVQGENPQDKARFLAVKHENKRKDPDHVLLSVDQTVLVWFCYILGGWKALVATTLQDDMYYEVTYNAGKKETYVDSYKKWENSAYPDEATD